MLFETMRIGRSQGKPVFSFTRIHQRTNQNNKTRHICTNSIRNSCILLQKTNKTWNSTHKHLLRQTRRLCSLRDLWLTFAHLLFLGCCCCKHSNHRLHHNDDQTVELKWLLCCYSNRRFFFQNTGFCAE